MFVVRLLEKETDTEISDTLNANCRNIGSSCQTAATFGQMRRNNCFSSQVSSLQCMKMCDPQRRVVHCTVQL
jgi:hypothetical protein